MASIFGHGMSALAFAKFFPKEINKKGVILLGVGSSILPDADMISFKLEIPYEHMFGHRGISHSILFALFWAILIASLFYWKRKRESGFKWIVVYLFICTVSHGILDAMTTGGRGICFFAPFSDERFFLPWRMIEVSPIHIEDFFGPWGWSVIQSEMVWIFIPCTLIILFSRWWR